MLAIFQTVDNILFCYINHPYIHIGNRTSYFLTVNIFFFSFCYSLSDVHIGKRKILATGSNSNGKKFIYFAKHEILKYKLIPGIQAPC